jgi:hypothetical protein
MRAQPLTLTQLAPPPSCQEDTEARAAEQPWRRKVHLQDLRHFSRDLGAARLLPDIASSAPNKATEDADLQGKRRDGSDGTRTRDLRRDRPVRGSRRLATMDAQSLYSCGFPGSRRTLSAWLSEAGFRRLLPVCCPRQRSSSDPPAHGGPRHQRFQLPLPSTNTMITRAGTAPPFSMRFGRSVV